MSPASLAKRSFRTVQPVSRLRLSAAQTRHYPRCACNVTFRSHRHELTNTTHDKNQKRSLFYSVVFMSKTIVFRKRYELKMGHFGEIRLADPVSSAVVLPSSAKHQIIRNSKTTQLSVQLLNCPVVFNKKNIKKPWTCTCIQYHCCLTLISAQLMFHSIE